MKQPAKFNAVNYPISAILLIIAALYLYFLSSFSGIAFFPIFFLILAVISFTHKYALIITENHIVYKPFPVFSKKIDLSLITGITAETGKVDIHTGNKKVTVRKYYLKNKQWRFIVAALEQFSAAS
jgi:hypothetical protein